MHAGANPHSLARAHARQAKKKKKQDGGKVISMHVH